VQTCVGVTSVRKDSKKINDGIHIIVGTPFRIHQMISKGIINKYNLKIIVLDEADSILAST
jgi:translation initiation factor 4A